MGDNDPRWSVRNGEGLMKNGDVCAKENTGSFASYTILNTGEKTEGT